jgi:hypothetical protein
MMTNTGNLPSSGDCGEPLGGNEFCKLQRQKRYYKCKDKACNAVTVKNLKLNHGANMEPCQHDNRLVINENIGVSILETAVPSGTTATRPYYHFPIVSRDEGSTSETFKTSGTNSNNQYHHFF